MRNPLTLFKKRTSSNNKQANESKSVFIILLGFFGWFFAALGILCLMLPLMTTPLIPQLAFWRGLLKISNHTRIEVFVGFWGVCTYYYKTTDTKKAIETKSMCTPARPVYSFHMSDHVPEAKGDLNKTQTLFFFWYPLAAVLTSVAIILSTSRNFRIWRYASFLCLTASIVTFSTFVATLIIFSELKSELINSQATSLLPIKGEILLESFLPLISSISLFLSFGFFFQKYLLQGRLSNHQNSRISDDIKSNLGGRSEIQDQSQHQQSQLYRFFHDVLWSPFKKFKTSKQEVEEKEIIKSKRNHDDDDDEEEKGIHKDNPHNQLPPPPPLQDKPTRKK